MNEWTTEEENFLRLNYKKLSNKEIGKTLNKSLSSIYNRAFRLNVTSNFYHDQDFFAVPNLINSYWAGFLAADGCLMDKGKGLRLVLELSLKDKDHLIKFKDTMKYNGSISYVTRKSPSSDNMVTCAKIRISVKQKLFDDLAKNFNITPRKTYRLAPPIHLNHENLQAFLIGYLDGDGCIMFAKNKISIKFISSSHDIILWIKEFCDKYFNRQLVNRESNIFTTKNAHIFNISGIRVCYLIDALRKIPVPKLARKWDRPEIIEFVEQKKKEFPHLFI